MSASDFSTLNDAQVRIATTFDRDLFVAAGAGSGKTYTLTQRIVWALSPQSGPDGRPYLDNLQQLLVITFTDAAAREIKERVRMSLRAAGLYEAALGVDDAWISTIHGMCARLIRRHALDLGISPSFAMCTTNESETFFSRAVDQVLGMRMREPHTELERECFENLTYSSIETSIKSILSHVRASSNGFDGLECLQSESVFEALVLLRESFEAFSELELTEKGRNRIAASLTAFDEYEHNLEAASAAYPASHETSSRIISSEFEQSEQFFNQADELLKSIELPSQAKAIAEERAALKEQKDRCELLVKLARYHRCLPLLIKLAREVDAANFAQKRDVSKLDNDDLISQALKLLEQAELARSYRGRFRFIMVDEFQDTDARQLRLIELLSSSDTSRVVTVGDAQQSIYRFRGADIEVFEKQAAKLDESVHIELTTNYRSHADILSFVERVCSHPCVGLSNFMKLTPNPQRTDAYVPQDLPRVFVEHSFAPNARGKVSETQRALSAAQLADRLRLLCSAGQAPSSMALLLGTTTHADLYIDALRSRGLECVVSGGSSFSTSPEAQMSCALLHFLANPHDSESGLFPLLASPLFDLEAADFLALATRPQEKLDAPTKRSIEAGLASDIFWKSITLSERLKRARDILKRAQESLMRMPLADVCFELLRESGYLSRLEQRGAEGRSVQANLLAAIRYIRDLTQELGLGPARAAYEFGRWLKFSKIAPASFVGLDDGAIQIMTVHASKGLEFDVVAVAELWSSKQRSSYVLSGEIPDSSKRQLVCVPSGLPKDLSVPPLSNISSSSSMVDAFLAFREKEQKAEAAEKARLLYVALTRAREALVVALPVAAKKDGSCDGLAAGVREALIGNSVPVPGVVSVACANGSSALVRQLVIEKHEDCLYADGAGLLESVYEGKLPEVPQKACLPPQSSYASAASHIHSFYELQRVCLERSVRMADMREGVFSYSSAHETLLSDTAVSHKQPVVQNLRQFDSDTDFSAFALADQNKATQLGSAFHQAAQIMVETQAACTAERLQALIEQWQLSDRQAERLVQALERWERSQIRAEALSYARLHAEYPFFMRVSSRFGDFVEGAIDLLAIDPSTRHALVIDYKTGDRDLSQEEIYKRHEMQANFYAAVLQKQGFPELDCAFVCVERIADGEEPLVVRYSFGPHKPPRLDW